MRGAFEKAGIEFIAENGGGLTVWRAVVVEVPAALGTCLSRPEMLGRHDLTQ
jgi:hypothetical protein